MGLFSSKDWNVIAVIFERRDLYRINGNRAKGGKATEVRDGAKGHARTIYWAVFDQKRAYLEGDAGKGQELVPPEVVARLKRELLTVGTVQTILKILEAGEIPMAAKPLAWTGYPKAETHPSEMPTEE
ncbi:MAG: hypothetical protein SH850_27755 [Planctomycetaceae bacterium]|nr:hypothetical protein [Planctomycetaceae bacterium]